MTQPDTSATLSPQSEIVERDFHYGTVRYECLAPGDWQTQKGEPARTWRRRYLIDGQEVTSPSALAGNLDKPALLAWTERVSVIGAVYAERAGELHSVPEQDWPWRVKSLRLGASAKRDEGAERGTIVHEALHTLATQGRAPDPAMVADYARPWLQGAILAWEALKVERIIEAEQIVGHPDLRYAGRFDLLCLADGLVTLVDWKTSPKGQVWPEAHWQARAYAMAVEHSLGLTVEAVRLVGVGPDGGFELVDCAASVEDVAALVHVHYARRRIEQSQRAQRRAVGAENDSDVEKQGVTA